MLSGTGAARRVAVTMPFSRVRYMATRPAVSSNTSRSPVTGRPWQCPARASTKAVPTLGWPANGISALGVKMRTRAVCAGSVGGSTKVDSARLNSAVMACICSVESPVASGMTASGLPPNLRSVKTSTVTKSSFMISNLSRPAKLAA